MVELVEAIVTTAIILGVIAAVYAAGRWVKRKIDGPYADGPVLGEDDLIFTKIERLGPGEYQIIAERGPDGEWIWRDRADEP